MFGIVFLQVTQQLKRDRRRTQPGDAGFTRMVCTIHERQRERELLKNRI